MATVGPGSAQPILDDVKPLLEGASEYEFVTILNPLTDDFAIRVGQDVPVNMPADIRAKTGLIQNESDVTRTYGLNLKNPDFQGRKHIVIDTVIKAGQTINLKGNEAQVAVRQLVNEILQREGQKRLMADPTLRREVEERIVISRGSVQDLMDSNLTSTRTQIDEAITKSNEAQNDTAFPGLSESTGTAGEARVASSYPDGNATASPERVDSSQPAPAIQADPAQS